MMAEIVTKETWDEIVELAGVEDSSGYWLADRGMVARPFVRGTAEFARLLLAASSVLDHDHALRLFGQPVLSGGVFSWPFLSVAEHGEDWVEMKAAQQ